MLVFHNLQPHLAALRFENLFRDDPLLWFVGESPPGHGSSLVPSTALQASCLETLRNAFRKANFVWCICGGEKHGLRKQKLSLIERCQLAYSRLVTAAGYFHPRALRSL